MNRDVAPWNVWWTDFDPQVGREQSGLRPAIVVGTAFACQLPNQLVFGVPCTTTDRQLPFHPRVTALQRPTFAMCDQLKSLSRERLVRRHSARLPTQDVDIIKFVLRQLIGASAGRAPRALRLLRHDSWHRPATSRPQKRPQLTLAQPE